MIGVLKYRACGFPFMPEQQDSKAKYREQSKWMVLAGLVCLVIGSFLIPIDWLKLIGVILLFGGAIVYLTNR